MAFAPKCFVLLLLLLSMATQGLCGCNYGQLQIGGVRTGNYISGQPEWKISVINTCKCLQRHVTLTCRGFAPANGVKPWILRRQGDACLLNNGAGIGPGASASFTYVGQPFFFRPTGSIVAPGCN